MLTANKDVSSSQKCFYRKICINASKTLGENIYLEKNEVLAKVRNLPFDRLRVNGLRLKLFSFSVRGELVEPQKNTFARASNIKFFSVFSAGSARYIFLVPAS